MLFISSHSFQNVFSSLPSSQLAYHQAGNFNAETSVNAETSETSPSWLDIGAGAAMWAGREERDDLKQCLKKTLKQRQAFSELLGEREIPRKERGTDFILPEGQMVKYSVSPGTFCVSLSD